MRTRVLALLVVAATPAQADELRPRANVVRVEHRPADQNPSLGPEDAPVTAELFFVPGNGESNRAYRKLIELQSRHPRRLRVVFRVIWRQAQVVVPLAALEAYAQGKFDAFMEAILARREGTVRREHLPAVAKAAGLDVVRLERALERAVDPEALPEPLRANERRRLRRAASNPQVPDVLFNGEQVSEQLSALDVDDLERFYTRAWDEAQELLADGVPVERLVDAAERLHAHEWAITDYPAGQIDDPEPGWSAPEGAPPLLGRPLELEGLPSEGSPDAPVTMVLACNLRYVSCRQQLELAAKIHDQYPEEVRLVWYPWYDTSVEGNEEAPRLHAAALCAEQQGEGWRWITETSRTIARHRGEDSVTQLIDSVAGVAGIDRAALDACLGEEGTNAAAVDARVRAAIAAGIDHSPSIVLGGRVYVGGFNADWRAAAVLVDAELAPGLLERMVPSWSTRRSR